MRRRQDWRTIDGGRVSRAWSVMTLLTEKNGWAIVWMNDQYYLRHLICGSYLKRARQCKGLASSGGRPCSATQNGCAEVDPIILAKYTLLIKGEK